MRVRVQKWGNSLAIRIPMPFAKETKIEQGSFVDLSAKEGLLIAKPIDEQEYTLSELLDAVTKKNRHEEIDMGEAKGREIW